jgi:hypothetical protein
MQSLVGILHGDGQTVTAQVVTWGHPFRHINSALNAFYNDPKRAGNLIESGPIHFIAENPAKTIAGRNAPMIMKIKDFANAKFAWRFVYDGNGWKVPAENLDGGIDFYQYPYNFHKNKKF